MDPFSLRKAMLRRVKKLKGHIFTFQGPRMGVIEAFLHYDAEKSGFTLKPLGSDNPKDFLFCWMLLSDEAFAIQVEQSEVTACKGITEVLRDLFSIAGGFLHYEGTFPEARTEVSGAKTCPLLS